MTSNRTPGPTPIAWGTALATVVVIALALGLLWFLESSLMWDWN